MEKIMTLVAVGTLIAGVAFAGYQYKEIHLPQFAKLQAKVEYQECIQRCIDTCRANGIPADRCKCDHCNVYKLQ